MKRACRLLLRDAWGCRSQSQQSSLPQAHVVNGFIHKVVILLPSLRKSHVSVCLEMQAASGAPVVWSKAWQLLRGGK